MPGVQGVGAIAGSSSCQDTKRLERGELLTTVSTTSPGVEVQTLIARDPAHIFSMLTDYGRLPERVFALREAHVLNRNAHEATVRFTMKLPFPIGSVTWTNVVHARQLERTYSIEWALMDGDLRVNDGRLVMSPHREHANITHAHYRVNVESRTRLPKSAERLATRWLLPKVVTQLRQAIEA